MRVPVGKPTFPFSRFGRSDGLGVRKRRCQDFPGGPLFVRKMNRFPCTIFRRRRDQPPRPHNSDGLSSGASARRAVQFARGSDGSGALKRSAGQRQELRATVGNCRYRLEPRMIAPNAMRGGTYIERESGGSGTQWPEWPTSPW